MCGIIGTVGILPTKEKFTKARDVLAHRGPNDSHVYYDKKNSIALGHRRLSIIDLRDVGRQPMLSSDKRFSIIFNGEIYNYVELKEELKDSYTFTTNTDTEVLLAAYVVWGEEMLSKLNGMFAFTIWDEKEKKLFGARDRLGIKPLYYALQNDTLYFASEIKGLLALGIQPEANDSIIYEYLAYGYYDHSNETFFDGIQKLSAGNSFAYKNGKFSTKNYWDLEKVGTAPVKISKKEAEEKFLELFADSIKLRLRSDVPVGVNFSSGVDSAAILFFAEKLFGKNLHTFSMCSSEKEYDECELIKPSLSSEQLKLWKTHTLNPESVNALMTELLSVQDEPYGGVPTIAYYELAKINKEHNITVILEGQGADEILGGYRYYQPEFLKKMEEKQGLSQDTSTEINTYVLEDSFRRNKSKIITSPKPFESVLLNAQYRDLKYTKLPRVLRFNDRLSMARSREYREPFLDHRLVEFCFFLPDELKLNSSGQKVLLREVMGNIVPSLTTARPKKTFGAIQTPWFRKYLKREIMEILSSESFGSRPYFNQGRVLESADKFFKGEGNNSFFIWQWVNLELWFRTYID